MGLAFIYPALPTCLILHVEKSDFHLINVFCEVVVVKKCPMSSPGVFSYFVLHSYKIPLVLTSKVTHLRSLLFRQPDGIDCVVRRFYFRGCPKTEQCSWWIMEVNRCVHVGLILYLLTFIGDLRYKMLFI